MIDDFLQRLDRVLTGDYGEYVIAAAAITVWWLVSKTVTTFRRDRRPFGGGPQGSAGPDEPRPRPRIPLY
ncbi:MAG: hypothetical protein ABIL09_03155 [Gemmatimonadota bacterium]